MRAAPIVLTALLLASPALAHEHHAGPEPAPVRGDSIYQIDERFVDQRGAPVALDVARGHPVIIAMFYASCRDACPLLIEAIRRVEAALPRATREGVHVVLVTLDPMHDTPEVLRALATAHGVDAGRWHLLRGSEAATREVAAVLGVKYRRLSSGVINHSSVIALLDRAGAVQRRVDELGQPTTPIVEALRGPSGRAR